jgi:hypothetical protein
MGGTTGGPKSLPSPATPGGAVNDDDAGYFGGLSGALPVTGLGAGIGPGQANLPGDVFGASSLMADHGILAAPTTAAGPEFFGGLETAQDMLGVKTDGFSLPGGETERAALAQAGMPGRDLASQIKSVEALKSGSNDNIAGPLGKARSLFPTSPPPSTPRGVGPELSNPRDLIRRAKVPRLPDAPIRPGPANAGPTLPDPARPATQEVDRVAAAGAFRQIAATPERLPRDGQGSAAIEGVKLDAAKADLLEQALKAQDTLDLERFDAALKRQDNRLTGPEKDFLRGVAENRFNDVTDGEMETLAADGLELLGAAAEPADTPADTPAGAPPEPGADTAKSVPRGLGITPDQRREMLDLVTGSRTMNDDAFQDAAGRLGLDPDKALFLRNLAAATPENRNALRAQMQAAFKDFSNSGRGLINAVINDIAGSDNPEGRRLAIGGLLARSHKDFVEPNQYKLLDAASGVLPVLGARRMGPAAARIAARAGARREVKSLGLTGPAAERYTDIRTNKPGYLRAHEDPPGIKGGGHTIDRHVGKTRQELQARLDAPDQQHLKRASTFQSLEEAESAISKVISANRKEIANWLNNTKGERRLEVTLDNPFGDRQVGKILDRGAEKLRSGTTVILRLLREPGNGFKIITAFVD